MEDVSPLFDDRLMETTYEKPIPLRTDTVNDAQMDTMVLLANECLKHPDAYPPTEVLKSRDICRLVSTVREKVALVEVEREAASIARVKALFQKKRADGYWDVIKNLRPVVEQVARLYPQVRATDPDDGAIGHMTFGLIRHAAAALALAAAPTTEPLKSAGDKQTSLEGEPSTPASNPTEVA